MYYYLVAFAALYLAQVERSAPWFFLALLFAAILIWVRLEAAVTVLPFLVAAAAAPSVELRRRTALVGGVAVVWAAWFAYLTIATAYSDHFERGHVFKGFVWVGLILSVFAGCLILAAWLGRSTAWRPWAGRAVGYLPGLLIVVLLIGYLVYALTGPDKLAGFARNFVFTFFSLRTGAAALGMAFVALILAACRWRPGSGPPAPNTWALAGSALTLPFVFANEDVWPGGGSPMQSSVRVMVQFAPAVFFWLLVTMGTPRRAAAGAPID